jgi:LAO/AO transport system kinase
LVETVGVGQDEVDIVKTADCSVVVLVPGMGDDVQALKAGLLEVAQLFVVNKADHEGADKLVRELGAFASVPILKTVASDGTGIAELVSALTESARPARAMAEVLRAAAKIDHLGIAVRSIDAALGFYRDQLGLTVSLREAVEREGVDVAMLQTGESRLELLQAASADSTVGKFIEKRGEGLHHVALRVADFEGVLARLRTAGARLLNEPRQGAGGHVYVFVHPASTGGVLIEIIKEH